MNDEINVTIASATGQAETISIPISTTLSDFLNLATALLGISVEEIEKEKAVLLSLIKDGKSIYSVRSNQQKDENSTTTTTLQLAGVKNGDLILVSHSPLAPTRATPPSAAAPAASATAASGGLDFSSLLNNNTSTSTSTASNNNNNKSGGLTFNLPLLSNPRKQHLKVEWKGMNLDQAIESNPNANFLIEVLFDFVNHPNLLKELNYHSPLLASQLKDVMMNTNTNKEARVEKAASIWRDNIMRGGLSRALNVTMEQNEERRMREKLLVNEMDEEANKYFGEKIREQNVESQYRQMMNEFPESMGRVLMLYIEMQVNNTPIQAFVDSGAQSTIMSASCAEKCGLLHLLDRRFEGVAVGVGTGKILGRIHIVSVQIKGNFFPCTITVMDDGGKGLGDKNMEFLLGLDMLKRHKCKIDLERNVLVFGTVKDMETPFLHEKDLDETKGGTKGFDAEKANRELQKELEEREKKLESEKKK